MDAVNEYVFSNTAIGTNSAPSFVLTCHCTEGAGLPLAAALNVAVAPDATVWLDGCDVTTGAADVLFTVSVAGLLGLSPAAFQDSAR
jgi:hypothetical protein